MTASSAHLVAISLFCSLFAKVTCITASPSCDARSPFTSTGKADQDLSMADMFSSFQSNELVSEADSPPAPEVRARIEVIVRSFLQSLMAIKPSIPSMSLTCRTAKNTIVRARGGCSSESSSIFLSYATFERSFTSGKGLKGFLRDVVALLHCSRHSLGILASSRGALVGRLLIQEPDGEVINCTTLGSNARVISGDIGYLEKLKYKSDARYILVVEKEAIFQRLAEDRFFMRVPSIIITGKGYPDLATRVVLHQLHKQFPALPIMALVDWNPAGLAIICTYKFGSMNMGLESPGYVCDVKWLGLRSEDILLIPPESQLNLKERDKTIAKGLLASKMLQNYSKHREELNKMLDCGKRVEIEALFAHGLSSKIFSTSVLQRAVDSPHFDLIWDCIGKVYDQQGDLHLPLGLISLPSSSNKDDCLATVPHHSPTTVQTCSGTDLLPKDTGKSSLCCCSRCSCAQPSQVYEALRQSCKKVKLNQLALDNSAIVAQD